MHTQMHFRPEARENYSTKHVTCEKHVRKSREIFSESGGTDPSDSSRISSNDSDGNEELGVQPYLYEPETNTEGNANITVLFYEITERVESKFWSFKTKSKQAQAQWEMFNVFMFVLPGYKFRHDVFITAVNTKTVSMVWTCRLARKWTGLCMGVLINGHLHVHWVFLALKNTSLLRWSHHSLLT